MGFKSTATCRIRPEDLHACTSLIWAKVCPVLISRKSTPTCMRDSTAEAFAVLFCCDGDLRYAVATNVAHERAVTAEPFAAAGRYPFILKGSCTVL